MSLSNNFPTTPPSLNLDFANVKALDPRVTFTRSTTATYYDGVTVAMAEQNLLTYSQEFDNAAWAGSDATITSNSNVAPDGTTTAETMTLPGGVSNANKAQQGTTGQTATYTASVYARVTSGTGKLYLSLLDGAWGSSTITTCSLTTTWQRFTVSRTLTAGNSWFVVIGQTNASTDATTSIIWGAQLEQRSSVTAYTATTTQPITNYIPVLQTAASGIPRFDHNPTTGESLGFLIEEARTNSLTNSEQFDNWIKNNETVTTNTYISPGGTLTADTVTSNSATDAYTIQNVSGFSAGATVSFSIFLKRTNNDWVVVAVSRASATTYGEFGAWFNLATGAVGSNFSAGTNTLVSKSITPVGNGWYRCNVVGSVPNATAYSPYTSVRSADGATGSVLNGSRAQWGAQLEAGAFPTSYIATIAAAATRNADVASIDSVSSWYDAAEGTLFAESTSATVPSTKEYGVAQLSYGTSINDAVFLEYYPNSTTLAAGVTSSGSTQAFNTGGTSFTVSNGNINKQAIAYKVNDFAYSANGVTPFTDSSGVLPTPGADRLLIGAYGASLLKASICIRRITYYPARLTNAQLQALTS